MLGLSTIRMGKTVWLHPGSRTKSVWLHSAEKQTAGTTSETDMPVPGQTSSLHGIERETVVSGPSPDRKGPALDTIGRKFGPSDFLHERKEVEVQVSSIDNSTCRSLR